MKRYSEDEYLLLSGIQHFVFCRRQWALIHIEQQWSENLRTIEGNIMHRRVHDALFHETRRDLIIARSMAVASPWLGLTGECDLVEFHQSADGITLPAHSGKYSVNVVEYKRGIPKVDLSDKLQLAAQVMCLEDMLCCNISQGYLFYGETRRRLQVEIDEELRNEVRKVTAAMHQLFEVGYTPKVKRSRACNACSLKNICLPGLERRSQVSVYLHEKLDEDYVNEKIT